MPQLGGFGRYRHPDEFYAHPPFADVGGGSFGEEPTLTVLEFYVTPFDLLVSDPSTQIDHPEDSVISDLYPGKIIGFAITIWDRDNPGPRDYDSVHSLHAEDFDDLYGFLGPDFFADGLLLPADGEIPADTAVGHITWARIKASLVE